jgi:hypothetical protein
MYLLAPEILQAARGMSVPVCVGGQALGLTIWVLGWRAHRFWIVLATTVAAGVYGLDVASSFRAEPLLAALLLATAAGLLALALARVLAFAAGGVAALLCVHWVAVPWDDPLLCFLVGGLLGVLLFRLWVMALTSLAGTLLLGYSSLCLLDTLGKLDAEAWATRHATVLNWAGTGLVLVGLFLQVIWSRGRPERGRPQDRRAYEPDSDRRGTWAPRLFRKAG